MSGSNKGLELIQEEDTQPSENTSEDTMRYGYYVDIEEHELGDLNKTPNYKAALADLESDKWLEAMNMEMQSMKDNQVLYLVDLPSNASRSNVAFLVLYVDDILLMGNNVTMLQEVKSWLCKCFSMKDLGEATYILGIKIIRDRSRRLISLSQSAYLEKILKNFRMENSKKGYTPMMEKPNYRKSQGAKHLLKYNQNPGEIHWTVVKTILKYLRNTKDMVLVYGEKPKDELKVSCYADTSFQTDNDDTKSQTGYVFVLNAEYIAPAEASMEAVWMRKFIDGLGSAMPSNKRPMKMLCDNKPALAIASDPEIIKGARHFQRKYHYIHEVIQEGEIVLKKVYIDDNVADSFTKPMPFNKHFKYVMAIGIVPASSLM
ncbi:retrotransposon protein, putative, ty1-copia subclass [Tanacetum coccineum]